MPAPPSASAEPVMGRNDAARSTGIPCVGANCTGRYRLAHADDENDDKLICGRCGDEWHRSTWTVLGAISGVPLREAAR